MDPVFRLQGVERLVGRGVPHHLGGRIVQLVQVHVVRTEPLEGPFEREGDVPRLEVHADAAVVEVPADLRREEDLVPAVFEGLTEDLLAVPPAVDVRGVEEVHSEIECSADCGD